MPAPPASGPETSGEPSEKAGVPERGSAGMDLHEVRRLWPSVLDRVKEHRRAVWMMLFEKSQVMDIDTCSVANNVVDGKLDIQLGC